MISDDFSEKFAEYLPDFNRFRSTLLGYFPGYTVGRVLPPLGSIGAALNRR
jgi:hypothetical protein